MTDHRSTKKARDLELLEQQIRAVLGKAQEVCPEKAGVIGGLENALSGLRAASEGIRPEDLSSANDG